MDGEARIASLLSSLPEVCRVSDIGKQLVDEYQRIYAMRLDLMARTKRFSDATLTRVVAVAAKLSDDDFARVLAYAEGLAEWDS
jgi:hypothetical protein